MKTVAIVALAVGIVGLAALFVHNSRMSHADASYQSQFSKTYDPTEVAKRFGQVCGSSLSSEHGTGRHSAFSERTVTMRITGLTPDRAATLLAALSEDATNKIRSAGAGTASAAFGDRTYKIRYEEDRAGTVLIGPPYPEPAGDCPDAIAVPFRIDEQYYPNR